MATFSSMVDEVLGKLSGYGMRSDATAYLPSSITASSVSFALTSGDLIGRGVIEIGDELIWVDSYDETTGTVTIPPYGRGFLGTVASSHAAGAMVLVNPTFTRSQIKQNINDVILASYPSLWSVRTSTFTYTPSVMTYALPSNAESVISVKYRVPGPTRASQPIRNYSVDPNADVVEFRSNSTITINSAVYPGATVTVVATTIPETLIYDGDEFSFTTGLPDSCKDVIVLGACHRLLSFVDPGRLQFETPDSDIQSAKITVGSGTNVAKYVYALYTQRLTEESGKLLRKFPTRVHYTN